MKIDEAKAEHARLDAACPCDDCRYREDCEKRGKPCEDYEEQPRIKNRAAKEGFE